MVSTKTKFKLIALVVLTLILLTVIGWLATEIANPPQVKVIEWSRQPLADSENTRRE
jgi:hypothetical protein